MSDDEATQVVLTYSADQVSVMGTIEQRAMLAVALVKDVVAERDRLRAAILDACARAEKAEEFSELICIFDQLAKQVAP
jgi:uncharacterized caspase-like protein